MSRHVRVIGARSALGVLEYRQATEYVTDVGYYQAAVRIGDLGRALADRFVSGPGSPGSRCPSRAW
jgi:hypothetical protein